MKRIYDLDEFKNKLKEISTKWKDTKELENIPIFSNPYKKPKTITQSNKNKKKSNYKELENLFISDSDSNIF